MNLPLRFWLCVVFAVSPYAKSTSRRASTLFPDSSEDINASASKSDGPFRVSAKDQTFDISASSTDILSVTGVTQRRSEDHKLLLRSSSHNVSGINGFTISSLPIFAHDLSILLSAAAAHIHVDFKSSTATPTTFFQYNTTKWSFTVITVPQNPIHPRFLLAILSRFIAISPAPTSAITTTIVGTLYPANTTAANPIADILILPVSSPNFTDAATHHPFSTSPSPPSPSSQNEIIQLTPYTTTCTLLSPNHPPLLSLPARFQAHPRRSFDPGSALLARVGQSAFYFSLRTIENAVDAHPVQVPRWMVVGMARLALTHVFVESVGGFTVGAAGGVEMGSWGIVDTGFFAIGRMVGRLVLECTKGAGWEAEEWRVVAGGLVDVVQKLEGKVGWAMEGEILEDGGGGGIGDGEKENLIVVGRWELWVGESGLRIEEGGG